MNHAAWMLGQQLVLYPVAGIKNFTNAERYKLIQVAKAVGADPEILAAVISIETAGTFRTDIQNPSSRATGLIQWLPSTAKSLHGTTVDKIKQMNACQQLDLVQEYFKKVIPGGVKIKGDEYVAVFYGSALGKPNSHVIAEQGTKVYELNHGLDIDKDGRITAGDVRNIAIGRAAAARTKPPIPVTPAACSGSVSSPGIGGGIGLVPLLLGAAIVGGGWWYFKS